MQMNATLATALAAAAMAFATTAASAQAYVGTWASNAAQCQVDQSQRNAPMVITRNRYDQHEAHCTFISVRKSGPGSWRARARCTVEGDRQMHTFTLAVQGSTLKMGERFGSRRLVRCK